MENLSQKEEIKAKAADYLDIVRSFSELLREENDALEKFETDKVAALYEQKSNWLRPIVPLWPFLSKIRKD